MSTYRLPEVLGGGEVKLVDRPQTIPGFVRVLVETAEESFPIDLPRSALVEVLPPEPAAGYYLLDDLTAASPFVAEHEEGYGWHVAGHEKGFAWSELCAHWPSSSFTRLVPDPTAESVELPWESAPRLPISRLSRSTVGRIRDFNEAGNGQYLATVDWTPEGARAKARALWAAADVLEAKSDGAR